MTTLACCGDKKRLRALVGALARHGIRPLVLLNANHGVPCPVRRFTAGLAAPAAAGARSVRLTRRQREAGRPGPQRARRPRVQGCRRDLHGSLRRTERPRSRSRCRSVSTQAPRRRRRCASSPSARHGWRTGARTPTSRRRSSDGSATCWRSCGRRAPWSEARTSTSRSGTSSPSAPTSSTRGRTTSLHGRQARGV